MINPILERIMADPVYLENIAWGKPRPGHPEGKIAEHINELEHNLKTIEYFLTPSQVYDIRILIHVHDTFKKDSERGVSISDDRSHASLARQFLAGYVHEVDPLLNMVQYHDEPYALYKQKKFKGFYKSERMAEMKAAIKDWDLFLVFCIVDGITDGKHHEPVEWFLEEMKNHEISTTINFDKVLSNLKMYRRSAEYRRKSQAKLY